MTVPPARLGTIRIGTRGSRLARWQADWVATKLREANPELNVELIEIKTHGDRDRNSPLGTIGGVGLFTKEIQRGVRDRLVDVAVHSLKDLPTQETPDLCLAVIPAREDVADALIAPEYQTLMGLPQGACVGTSSPRRRAQLLFLRPDLQVNSIRGNVETRLSQALDGKVDAVMLAWAGLHRLGLEQHVTERLDPLTFLPAVGQGALGIECRRDDAVTLNLLRFLDDAITHRAVLAERATLAALEGGCTLPMAAWARDSGEDEAGSGIPNLVINATIFDVDGRDCVRVSLHGSRQVPEVLGRRAAQVLCERGAIRLMERPPSFFQ